MVSRELSNFIPSKPTSPMDKRLFLLDAYALIYRAYYALIRSPRMSSAGFNTSAIFGFCNTLDDLLRKENPTHIAVCFDPHGPTFRHKEFEAYKAQRDKQPEDITLAIPWIKRILEAYRIPVVEVEGYEADDVIGTLATRAAAEGFDTYMMTPDKDYGQLVDGLGKVIGPDGRIHTSFQNTVTATGRISSTNPNLQNIPVRTDDGREIRRAFIADPGDVIMSADYSQIELRLIADLSGDKDMIEGFLSGDDIHRITASKIYGVPLAEVTDDQRRHAKTANFGIVYGISAFGLSERLGIARAEAKKLIDGYFATYPHIREYLDRAVVEAREKGYALTRMGRRRYLPDITSRSAAVRAYAERNAVNAPIQGTAADIIKVAMVRIFAEMERRGLRSRMIMQVHDELIFNIVPSELDEMRELVERGMADAYHGAVPLIAEAGTGDNWLEAH